MKGLQQKEEINVNHTLVYYNHAENGCYFAINTPKTKAGKRVVPMLDMVMFSTKVLLIRH